MKQAAEKPRHNWQNKQNQNNKVEQETKEMLDRSARNGRRRCPSGTPGDARDAPIKHFQQKGKNK